MRVYGFSLVPAVVCVAALASPAGADVITLFDFDTHVVGGRNLSLVLMPDLSATVGRPYTFPDSHFDVFGPVTRSVNTDFADDSALDPFDMFGILGPNQTTRFFGVEDLQNASNPDGTASARWTFDISGFVGVSVSIDIAAMGNFEGTGCTQPCFLDQYNFTASIDGGPNVPVFTSEVDENGTETYVLQGGTEVTLDDPMFMNGLRLSNIFQTLTSGVIGSGHTLVLTLNAQGDSTEENIAFDNIAILGTAAPSCGSADFNCDGDTGTDADIEAFFGCLAGNCPGAPCTSSADFNGDGDTGTDADIEAFFRVLAGGAC